MYQKLQPSKLLASPDDADLMGYHRSQFHRIRRLMPERDRLASNLFLVAPIRSDEGRSILRDMIALSRQEAEVPSARPMGHCVSPVGPSMEFVWSPKNALA